MQLYTQHKRILEIEDTPFAKGGQGAIHAIKSPVTTPTQVAKLYLSAKKAREVERRIVFMVNNNPFINAQQMVADSFAWPLDLLFNKSGEFVGFTMQMIENSKPLWNLTLAKGFKEKAWDKFNIGHHDSYNKRLKVLYNVCQALDVLDKSGMYRVVDLKPQNMMLVNNAHIRIIDCDSFQIAQSNSVLFQAEAATEEYCPPEFHQGKVNFRKQFVDPSWDYFAFAVTAYQILFCIHPFIGSHKKYAAQSELIQHGLFVHGRKKHEFYTIPPPHKNFDLLIGKALKQMFMDAFDEGYRSPTKRPPFNLWRDELLKELNRVSANPGSIGKFQPCVNTKRKKVKQPPKQKVKHHIPKRNNHVPTFGAVLHHYSLQTGKYTARLTWNVSNAKYVTLNGKSVSLHASEVIPLENKTYVLTLTDYNGQVKAYHKTVKMPAHVELMPVQEINAQNAVMLNSHIKVTGIQKINVALATMNNKVTTVNSPFQNQIGVQKIREPHAQKHTILRLTNPVKLDKHSKAQESHVKIRKLYTWLRNAAASIIY